MTLSIYVYISSAWQIWAHMDRPKAAATDKSRLYISYNRPNYGQNTVQLAQHTILFLQEAGIELESGQCLRVRVQVWFKDFIDCLFIWFFCSSSLFWLFNLIGHDMPASALIKIIGLCWIIGLNDGNKSGKPSTNLSLTSIYILMSINHNQIWYPLFG